MKRNTKKRVVRRNQQADGLTDTGREIIASLREAIEVERAGIPIEKYFTVRVVEYPPKGQRKQ
jgi:hypothetical protein